MTKPAPPLSLVLGFLSGYIDTAVFVHMKGLFVAHVTGNFVLLGTTLTGTAGHAGSATLQLAAFPIFFGAAGIAAIIAGRSRPERRTVALLWLVSALIMLAGALALTPQVPDTVLALVLVVAMGVLNAAQRLDAGLGPPFTVMTGNVTALAIAATRFIGLTPASDDGRDAMAARTMLLLVLSFGLGCATGAASQAWLGLDAMLAPAALLAVRLAFR